MAFAPSCARIKIMTDALPTPLLVTDYIVGTFLLVFIISGWAKGFVRSIIWPVSLAVNIFISIFYFDLNRTLVDSILFGLAGALLMTGFGYLCLLLIRRATSPDSREYIFWGSRLLGACFSLLWKGSLLFFIIVLVSVLPPTIFGLEETQKNIKSSATYYIIESQIISRISLANDIREFLALLDDQERLKKVKTTKEFQDFIQDGRMQDLLNDPQTVDEINKKDAVKLLFNKKVVALFNDKDFIEKFIAFGKVMYASRAPEPPKDYDSLP